MAPHLRVAIGADHGGFELKQALIEHLKVARSRGAGLRDLVEGPRRLPTVRARRRPARRRWPGDLGIVVDGAGIGSAMTANKVPGVLAAACYIEALARNAREHNDANVLTLGAAHVGAEAAKAIVDVVPADRVHGRAPPGAGGDDPRDRARRWTRSASGGGDLDPADVTRIAERVKQLLASRRQRSSPLAIATRPSSRS